MQQNQTSPKTNPLGTAPITKLLLKYALPSVVGMIVMSLYNIVDQIFIGRGVGYLGNSATTIAFPITTIMLAIALLIGNGSAAFISLEMGRGNNDKVKKTVGTAVTVSFALGVLLAVIVLIFLKPILVLFGATEAVMPYAVDYLSVIAIGAPFAILSTALASVIRADGSPRLSMMASLIGAVLNVILDPIFIFVFNMGVKGAAIATVISQIVATIISVGYLVFMANQAKLTPKYMIPDFNVLQKLCALGSSSFITQISITLVNIVLNNSLRLHGASSVYGSEIALAAMGIVMKVNAIMLAAILGIVIGAQPILGFNYGAGNYARVKKTYLTEIIITTIVAGLGSLVFIFAPNVIIQIFDDPSAQFNEFAARCLRIFLLLVVTAGIQIPSANFFQATGRPLKAMLLSMCRQLFLLIPALIVLPIFFGINGVLYAGPLADIGSLCITSLYMVGELRRIDKLIAATPTGTVTNQQAIEPNSL